MAINPAEITTIRVGELTPGTLALDSKLPIENDTDLERITGQDLVDFVNTNANTLQFEIKDLYVSQTYIDDNFSVTGLGENLCLGYAICNGQNGTPNLDGLVSIGYGTNYNVIKAVGGSKNAVLVEHSHTIAVNTNAAGSGFPAFEQSSTAGTFQTSTQGVSGVNKNMQPYMVLLKIMKL